MNRTTTALLAALEALIAVAIGIGIPLVPLTVLWGITFGMGPDWAGFWSAAVDIWLLGHGVDLMVALPPALAASTGVPGAEQPFPVTIALLGFAVITVLSGLRAGRRSAIGGARMAGVVVSVVAFGALAVLAALSVGADVVRPSHLQAFTLPALIYLVAVFAGSEWSMRRIPAARRDPLGRAIHRRIAAWPAALTVGIGAAFRGAAGAVSGVIAVSAVVVALSIFTHYATITSLFETLQAGLLGGAAITVLQLALLPNLIVWAASWLVGPGFAVGAASSVAPGGTVLGSVPGLPVLGALPQGDPAVGVLGVLVPIALGALAGWACQRRMPRSTPLMHLAAVGAGIGLLSGLGLGLLAWWSGGAVGPGRLAQVGPDPWLVGALSAVEIGLPAIIAVVVSGWRSAGAARAFADYHAEGVDRS
ncbi:MAG: DUF6350 family protein [Leifsonia sp.]